ncbi:alpha/beta hydrolase [Jiangella asiatica]|uniref:Alpha/beta fold hydrolase n=1 Tax=Jiangella asiatica TaxID=2530372 RepID=A0A4R5CL09_9ACTN|nr:alpha/beta fold hydrolase [Jiangella asiatica]TDD99073.1 alpha/beta fold hydrolase [Jiangella asiatica]
MTLRVRVDGGELSVHELTAAPDGAPLVVALHGITANALALAAVAAALDGNARVLAPDLRGRAESRAITGPWGLAAHAADVIAVLDALGARSAVLLGHSMGAYVAALTALRHPARVDSVVLVDGGVGFPAPPGTDIDAALEQVIGPAMRRLGMVFADDSAYLDFWRAHPAIGPGFEAPWRELLVGYLLHDLVGPDGARRSSCVLDAVRADGADVLADAEVLRSVRDGTRPTTLLWAQRGMLDEPQGLFDDDRLAAAGLPPGVSVVPVGGVNHYTVLFEPRAVRTVASAVAGGVSGPTSRRR